MTDASTVQGLPTPAALVDLGRLQRNCEAMLARARRLDVTLRPHVKTHKCPEIARIQCGGAPGPITVSTLAEARAFAAAGFRDITWAVPPAPARVPEALALGETVDALHLLIDSADALDAVEVAAGARGVHPSVWLKVDSGYHRAGVDPEASEAIDLGRRLAGSPRAHWAGLLTHAGQAYGCVDADAVRAVARREREAVVTLANRLAAAGVPPGGISVGSTPTVIATEDLSGVDEVRPGNYAFFDVFQAAIGCCSLDDVAFSVLATIIGRYPRRGTLVLDAGALALSKDPGPFQVDPDCGFGVLASADGTIDRRLRLTSLSQEHGLVRVEGGLRPGELPIGSRMRVLPNHSCLAAALFPAYHGVEGDRIVDVLQPVRGW